MTQETITSHSAASQALRRPPGPTPHPLNLYGQTNLIRFARNPRVYMERMRRDYGDVVRLTDGAPGYLFAFGEANNRAVLGDPDTFYNLAPQDTPMRVIPGSALSRLYNGLIQMNGPTHKSQRKLIARAMNAIWCEQTLVEMAAIVRRRVAALPTAGIIDLAAECREISLQVALKTLLGLDPSHGARGIAAAMDEWTRLVFSPFSFLLPFDLLGLPYARLQRLSEEIEAVIGALIAERQARGHDANDVLGALIDDAQASGLGEDALIGQTNFLFMAGHLTTASAMAWTLFCVMVHRHVVDQVAADGAALNLHDLLAPHGALSLSEAVINETLRLFPPVVWWTRIAQQDFALGGNHGRAGTRIIHSPFVSHRDPAHFSDPYRFNPQRWFARKPSPFAYCPFSAGPRMCLGERLAIAEIRLLLKHVFERFTPTLPPGARIDIGGLMLSSPSPGLFARLDPPGTRQSDIRFSGTVHSAFRYDAGSALTPNGRGARS